VLKVMPQTTRPDGRKGRIPKSLVDFFGDLEARPDISAVRGGKFFPRGYARRFIAKVQHYCPHNGSGGTLRIKAQNRGYVAYFNLDVIDGHAKDVVKYVADYKPVGNYKKFLYSVPDGIDFSI
jgi:hypothetical protein